MKKTQLTRADGRYVCWYAFDAPPPHVLAVEEQERGHEQIELRWNSLLGEQVIVSTGRQARTFLPPEEYCPLCPTAIDGAFATEIPSVDFEVVAFENRFPSFRPDAPDVDDDGELRRRGAARGVCEVIVYSPEHDATLASLTFAQVRHLVDVWADRYAELAARPEVAYVFIFENRGKEIGVTLTHPHGQIYAFPFVPPRVEQELAAAAAHYAKTGRCVVCDVVVSEIDDGRRIVARDGGFVAYVPFAARLPYEVHVAPAEHRRSLLDLDDGERDALARLLRRVQATYDGLWGFQMPYTMVMHQRTTDGVDRPGEHLHIEFAPPYRSRDKLKYLAGVETGAGTFINDTAPEEKAAELRAAWNAGAVVEKLTEMATNLVAGRPLSSRPDLFIHEPRGSIEDSIESLSRFFEEEFAHRPEGFSFAPGRVNLIGEHVDYNDGLVLPAAINRSTGCTWRRRADDGVRVYYSTPDEHFRFEIGDLKPGRDQRLNYVRGVVNELKKAGEPIGGVDLVISGNIPWGSGLSSSAAYEVAVAAAFRDAFALPISDVDLALLCQRAENEYVGVQCGIMDQFASTLSRRGHALLLDCRSLAYEHVPLRLDEAGLSIVIADSAVTRELASSAYNDRRRECEEAVAELRARLGRPGLSSLRDVTEEEMRGVTVDTVPIRRARHVVAEIARVRDAADALRRDDFAPFGELMRASHASLRDDYEVSSPQLDRLVQLASAQEYVLGSRLTGAGFGGCTVSLVRTDAVESFERDVIEPYCRATGLPAKMYVTAACDGLRTSRL